VFQTLLIYDLLTKKYIRKLNNCYITPSLPREYVFLNDEHLLGLADNRSHLVVWSTVTGHMIHRLKPAFKDAEKKSKETELAEVDEMRRKRAMTAKMTPWDRRTESKSAKEKRHLDEISQERQHLEDLLKERENIIQQFKISSDLSTVITAHYAHHLCVFDVESQTHTHTLESFGSMMLLYISALTYSGSHLVHTNYDEEEKMSYLTLWDARQGFVRKRLRNEKNVTCVDISSDAHRIVFGKSTKELRIWEPFNRGHTMRRVKGYPTLNFGVQSQIHIIDDGQRAVVYAGDISIWDLENPTVLGVFTPDMRIQSFTIAMNGKLIAFGLQDTSDIVTLRLMSNQFRSITKTGQDLFGEVISSDEDDEEMEAQLDQE
jgi:WD40 repeat protein